MKSFLLVFFFFFYLITINAQQQGWFWVNPKPQGNTINKVVTISGTKAVAVGDAGVILLTSDRGETWRIKYNSTNVKLNDASFYDSLNGIAVGDKSNILKTTDGGDTGTIILSDGTYDFIGVSYYPDAINIVSSYFLYRSVNGGQTWEYKTLPFSSIRSVDFINFNVGLIACGYYGVWRTTDGGTNWTKTFSKNQENRIARVKNSFLYLYSSDLEFYKSSDFGATFILVNTGMDLSYVSSFSFSDAANGYAVSGDTSAILRTTNGGYTWQKQPYSGIEFLYSTAAFDANCAIGVGVNGSIIRTTNGGAAWVQYSSRIYTKYLQEISFINESTGYLVESSGLLYKSINGGMDWSIFNDFGAKGPRGVKFCDKNHGVVICDFFIYSTTNGGVSWLSTPIIYGDKSTISYGDSNNVLVIPWWWDKLYRSTNGGVNWTTSIIPIYPIQVVHKNAKDIFIAGRIEHYGTGKMIRSTDGGITWGAEIFFAQGLVGVSFSDSLKGTALGCWGEVYKSVDGGISWYSFSNTPLYELGRVSFVGANQITATGRNKGYVVQSTNGGLTWFQPRVNMNKDIVDIKFIDKDHGFILGTDGAVLKTNDGGGGPYITPVELTYFTAKQFNKGIRLEWETASELNNMQFQVERSTDRKSFYTVGIIKGEGNSINNHRYFYNDIIPGLGKYYYRLRQVDFNGNYSLSSVAEVSFTIPYKFALLQNYPNPFNPDTKIQYVLPSDSKVTLKVFDILGKEIAELVNDYQKAAIYDVEFNAANLSNGIYFYQLQAGSFSETKKMILIK